MLKTNKQIIIYILLLFVNLSYAQSILGKWKTIDDRNGVEKAIINIYEQDGAIFGKVIEILEEGKENAKCVKCKGERKGKPILGMTIIENLHKEKKGIYTGKTLFDPQQAMTFRCKIWLNPDNSNELYVRGYLAFLYRTQTWVKVEE